MKLENIDHLNENQLLQTRICDLPLDYKNTPLVRGVNQLYFELNEKLINFLPHTWLADDWFSPDGVAGFAMPFYLAHPKLIEMEKKHIGFVEGTTHKSLMKLLRHEVAHALDNAFHLRKIKTRQDIFGLSSKQYPKSYLPNPKSKNFVRHLEDFYAQAHPDEDWAETFATWITPEQCWETKYQDWSAIHKLNLVDSIFENLKNKKQKCFNKQEVSSSFDDTRTLKEYYSEKRKIQRVKLRSKLSSKISPEHLPYVLVHKGKISKNLAKKMKINGFIVDKMLKEISLECKNKKINLKYTHSIYNTALEDKLISLTQEYIKQGRHRIVM